VDTAGNSVYANLDVASQAAIRTHDLGIIRDPYIYLGLFVIGMMVVIGVSKMPQMERSEAANEPVKDVFGRLFKSTLRLACCQRFMGHNQTFIIHTPNVGSE
jgi:FHS family L-fucose permease-like MFS transporter